VKEADDHRPNEDWSAELEECLPGLRSYVEQRAGKLLLRQESVDDIVQSACREALLGAKELEEREDSVQTSQAWLHWHATRKIIDRARRMQREKRDPGRLDTVAPGANVGDALGELYRTTMNPSSRAMRREDLALLDQAIDLLPEQQSLVIRLAYHEGLSREEIAEIMGRPSSNAVQSLLSRAIAKLAVIMRNKHSES